MPVGKMAPFTFLLPKFRWFAVNRCYQHPSGGGGARAKRICPEVRILQINVLDHDIVGQSFDGRPDHFSFREAGIIDEYYQGRCSLKSL
jgi:hypothetical protein